MEIIITQRLIIRPFAESDIESAYKMNLDPKVSQYTGDGGIVSLEETRKRIKNDVLGDYKKYGYGRMAVELKNTQEFIGFTGLKYLEDMNKVDLGFRFLSTQWGKGYATESALPMIEYGFEKLQLQEIIAMVLPRNKASVHVLEKLKFKYQTHFLEDQLDVHLYSRQRAHDN